MIRVTLGSAPDSWGVWFPDDPKQTPWHRFLDEVSAVGYRWIELGPFGYLPTEHSVLLPELERRQLSVSGTFVMFPFEELDAWDKWGDEVERTCAALKALGGKYVILIDDLYSDLITGAMLASSVLDDRAWSQLLKTTSQIADAAERHSLTPVLHPHAESHIEYESQVERFLAEGDPRMCATMPTGGEIRSHLYAATMRGSGICISRISIVRSSVAWRPTMRPFHKPLQWRCSSSLLKERLISKPCAMSSMR